MQQILLITVVPIALPATQTWDDIKANHPITNQDNSGVTVRFGGSDSIQKVAEALTNAFKPKPKLVTPQHVRSQ